MFGLRRYFLLDPHVIFLNHGSFGATPRPVFRAYQRWGRELERQPVEFLGRRATHLMAGARASLGAYLGMAADNLFYTRNVIVSINIAARSLALGAGDEVLSTDHEYGAMDRTWRFLSKERGFIYINQPVSLTSRADFIESFWDAVTPRTRVIFLSHITSPTAIILPIEEIIQRARAAGILTVIDGAHAPGQIPLALDALGADFYSGNLHKRELPRKMLERFMGGVAKALHTIGTLAIPFYGNLDAALDLILSGFNIAGKDELVEDITRRMRSKVGAFQSAVDRRKLKDKPVLLDFVDRLKRRYVEYL